MGLDERFWSKVDKRPDGCWQWTSATASNGYGRFGIGGRMWPAHRVAYELMRGPIPDGLTLDHLCRNVGCVNPDHLEPVTMKENILRGYSPAAQAARRDECAHGHAYTPENTYRYANGSRRCRICQRAAQARTMANPERRAVKAEYERERWQRRKATV